MARIRTIKPEFPQSESLGGVSRDARLLFVSIWTIADDYGRARAASRMLASILFPYDDDAPSMIDGWLAELEQAKCIVRYRVDGATYLEVCNWLKHQKIDKPTPSRIPSFDEASRAKSNAREETRDDRDTSRALASPREECRDGDEASRALASPREASRALASPREECRDGGEASRTFAPRARGLDLGPGPRTVEEDQERPLPSEAPSAKRAEGLLNPSYDQSFAAWWSEYPRKVGKDAARKVYAQAVRRGVSAAELMLALRGQRWPEDPQFIPHPTTWLSQGRWQDDPGAAAPIDRPPPKPPPGKGDWMAHELDLTNPRTIDAELAK